MVDNPIIVELEEATVEISPEAQEMEVSSWHIVRSCADIEEVNLNSNSHSLKSSGGNLLHVEHNIQKMTDALFRKLA
ncbi:hypothetical protein Bhyg_00458 [Pseudolycoriella hygida]|uniref:Uncharacterized protein n=2 Tax=Pseudolycoriella hygida TaxID=35572 RepID=A0A9Q0N7X6_9DIPT|nr:hypothetical protein Bhyg_00458 [Pseudolycoriella hygida]